MAKVNKRVTVKGKIDMQEGLVVETDKDGNIHRFVIADLFSEFDGLDDVTVNIAHDEQIVPE